MRVAVRLSVGLVIAFHLAAFTGEALLWMLPAVHSVAIAKLNPGLTFDASVQAMVLRRLFINQGFYNLFLSIGGMVGLAMCTRGRKDQGVALLLYTCTFASGAGFVLMMSTEAYLGGALQFALGAVALYFLRSTNCSTSTPTTQRAI